MFDVVALGESLIDFTPNGTNAQGIELFARNPGGASGITAGTCKKRGREPLFRTFPDQGIRTI